MVGAAAVATQDHEDTYNLFLNTETKLATLSPAGEAELLYAKKSDNILTPGV